MATTSATAEPLSAELLPAGDWLSTVPTSAFASSFWVTVTVKPAPVSVVRAASSCVPTTSGTVTFCGPVET